MRNILKTCLALVLIAPAVLALGCNEDAPALPQQQGELQQEEYPLRQEPDESEELPPTQEEEEGDQDSQEFLIPRE